ncbi:MAG: transketolase [Firmicutes bacterium HGW-Firmicutes-20]|nr:MAG: transketolase [Firmicutes bacterium HGW-Firmicutes-20]PKM69281.1 MAG: transketolase [Firmicutes bacterium HGW-Firmicutes-19]
MLSKIQIEDIAKRVRINIVKMVNEAKSGHIGGSLSGVEILTTLYFNEMNINQDNIKDLERDKFVLSKGHATPLLFAVHAEKGFIPQEELMTFRKINSRLQGHPNMNYVDSVDMSTGSLGQGISAAVGMALSYKAKGLPYRVYSLLGDGETQEGIVWEAAMAAAHYKLDNLLAIVDLNGLQIDGDITKIMNPLPIDEKFKAFGWNVLTLNGHDIDALQQAYALARECKGRPTVIIALTVKGKGVSFMENDYGWHGVATNPEQFALAMKELGGE